MLNPSCDPKRLPKTWGVIFGVNFYQYEGISELKGAVADAWAFYHFLASPKGGNVHQSRLRLLLIIKPLDLKQREPSLVIILSNHVLKIV